MARINNYQFEVIYCAWQYNAQHWLTGHVRKKHDCWNFLKMKQKEWLEWVLWGQHVNFQTWLKCEWVLWRPSTCLGLMKESVYGGNLESFIVKKVIPFRSAIETPNNNQNIELKPFITDLKDVNTKVWAGQHFRMKEEKKQLCCRSLLSKAWKKCIWK